jgi:citrate synthase
MTSSDKVTVTYGEITADLPVITAVDGHDAVDMSKFTSLTGLTSYDQGFVNTASTKSAITFIDGEKGILRHRGYPIEQLAGSKSFLETAWLLIYGELPTPTQLTEFEEKIRRHTLVHEDLKNLFHAMPQNAHPMAVLAAGVSALSTFYQDSLDPHDPEQVELSTIRLLAKLPVLAAYAHKNSMGQALLYPDNSLSYVENFLRLNFGNMAEEYAQNPVVTKALDTLLVLHADHEQNCSTSTVRLVGSSQANLFASISSGINALFGPLHGGANEAVLEMLQHIQDSGESVQAFIQRVKNKEDGIRLMGFGHRVYKNLDPRARIVKATADQVLAELGVTDPLLQIAKELEAAALADSYFQERKLYPNVDFYTGVIYKALGFPPRM